MNKRIVCVFLLALFGICLFADDADSVVLSYRRNFIRASLLTKLELLNDASRLSGVDMSLLYTDAILFVLQNSSVLGNDSSLIDLATVAVAKAGDIGLTSVAPSVWKIFLAYDDSKLRCAAFDTLGRICGGSPDLVSEITQYMGTQVTLLESGTVVDYKVFTAGLRALGSIGSGDSFPVLFHAAMGNIDSLYKDLAFQSIIQLKYDFKETILGIFRSAPEQEKIEAFRLAMRYPNIADLVCGEIAESALSIALKAAAERKENSYLSELRFESIPYLTKLNWVQASPLVVEHFYLTQSDFRKGQVSVVRFVESIQCLGSMGTAEAAQGLAIYLGLLNSEMEQTKTYNEQVLLAVIDSLSRLGDKSAFDYLLYVGYLDYPESVKKAARDALAGLKW